MIKTTFYAIILLLIISSCNETEELSQIALKRGNQKILICHYDLESNSSHTIEVNENAITAHLNHGDKLGECREEFDGLLAFYPFSGNTNDESGNEYHADLNGAILTKDRLGNDNSAFSFDGIDDYIVAPINMENLFDVGDPVTFSLWIKSDFNSLEYFDFILGGVPGGGPVFFAAVREGDAGKLRVRLYGGSHGFSDSSVLDGSWHHIVWGLDSNNATFYYVDGQSQLILPSVGSVTGETELIFGGRLDGNLPFTDFFTGCIDDIRIFNRGLTEAEILDLYNFY